MSEKKKEIMILADTIKDEINRMCVTESLTEFDTMYGHAKKNIEKLSKMIYDDRFKVEEKCSDYYKGYCASREDGCFHQCKNAPTTRESEE